MKRVWLYPVLAAAIMALPASSPAAGGRGSNPEAKRLLEEELSLAKAPNFYYMFNLREKTIALKSKGIVLRSWAPEKVRYWGKPVEFKAIALSRKTALTPPQRNVIKPGEEEAPAATPAKPGEFELPSLEIKDMPPDYTIELEDGTLISVAPAPKGLAARLIDGFKWSVSLPWKTFKLSAHKKTMTLISVTFKDPKEGQALYWALTDGMKGLVYLPSGK
jgi:hypothetical protein